jgi:hypothetical protein
MLPLCPKCVNSGFDGVLIDSVRRTNVICNNILKHPWEFYEYCSLCDYIGINPLHMYKNSLELFKLINKRKLHMPNTIQFNGKTYACRTVKNPYDWHHTILVSTQKLEQALLTEDRKDFISPEAEVIDDSIAFYVNDREINLPQSELDILFIRYTKWHKLSSCFSVLL